MIADEENGQRLLKQIAEVDVANIGYLPLPDGFALVEGYDERQIEVQDRLARILYGAIISALSSPKAVQAGSRVFANTVAQAVSVILAETGWNDDGSENKIEVKRSAG